MVRVQSISANKTFCVLVLVTLAFTKPALSVFETQRDPRRPAMLPDSWPRSYCRMSLWVPRAGGEARWDEVTRSSSSFGIDWIRTGVWGAGIVKEAAARCTESYRGRLSGQCDISPSEDELSSLGVPERCVKRPPGKSPTRRCLARHRSIYTKWQQLQG